MFDIGFTEILLVAVVALVVLGPERLPRVARTVGHLLGRFQRYANQVKGDISREMQLDDLRKMQAQMQQTMTDLESSVKSEVGSIRSGLDETAEAVQSAASGIHTQVAQVAEEAGGAVHASPTPMPTPASPVTPSADVSLSADELVRAANAAQSDVEAMEIELAQALKDMEYLRPSFASTPPPQSTPESALAALPAPRLEAEPAQEAVAAPASPPAVPKAPSPQLALLLESEPQPSASPKA